MSFADIEIFRRQSKLTFDKIEKLLEGINICDIEEIQYVAQSDTYKIIVVKEGRRL